MVCSMTRAGPLKTGCYGPEQRSEVLIATVPAEALLRAFPQAERLCARPVPLSGAVARSIAAFIGAAIERPDTRPQQDTDIVAYLSALLHLATCGDHRLPRAKLFGLIDTYLRANIGGNPAGAGDCCRIRRFRANLPSHFRRSRDDVRAACPAAARRAFPEIAAAISAVRRLDRGARDAMRLCRRRSCDQDVQEFLWSRPAGFPLRALSPQNG